MKTIFSRAFPTERDLFDIQTRYPIYTPEASPRSRVPTSSTGIYIPSVAASSRLLSNDLAINTASEETRVTYRCIVTLCINVIAFHSRQTDFSYRFFFYPFVGEEAKEVFLPLFLAFVVSPTCRYVVERGTLSKRRVVYHRYNAPRLLIFLLIADYMTFRLFEATAARWVASRNSGVRTSGMRRYFPLNSSRTSSAVTANF